MTCMCGDSECPSCGRAQGTHTETEALPKRCCCGKKMLTETLIINDIQHEVLGNDGAFCGPKIKHDLRDFAILCGQLTRDLAAANARMVRFIPATLTCAKCKRRLDFNRCPNAVFRDDWVFVGEGHPACVRHEQGK